MILGALVSAGLSWTQLVSGLKRLRLKGYSLRKRDVHRGARQVADAANAIDEFPEGVGAVLADGPEFKLARCRRKKWTRASYETDTISGGSPAGQYSA